MPPNKTYSFREFSDKRLRSKDDTGTDDPDWADLVVDPNTIFITFAGVIADGNYRATFTPTDADVVLPGALTTVRAAGVPATFAALAIQHAIDFNAAAAAGGVYEPYVESAVAVGDVCRVTVKHNAPEFTTSFAAPGGATLVGTPDDTWPITATTSNSRGMRGMPPAALVFAFVAVDASDEPLPDDTGMTFTVELVRVVERVFRGDPPNQPARTVGVTSSVATAGHVLTDELRVPFHGGRFGLRISSFALPVTNLDRLEVHWREVIT